MSEQPKDEDMTTTQQETENGRRMIEACDNDYVAAEKARLARASRTAFPVR